MERLAEVAGEVEFRPATSSVRARSARVCMSLVSGRARA